MNVAVTFNTGKLNPRVETPYTVVIQFRNRNRSYIKCETMANVRQTIVSYRRDRKVTYFHYNISELEHIEAYDVRNPTRYV
jgi:hypothetical protein